MISLLFTSLCFEWLFSLFFIVLFHTQVVLFVFGISSTCIYTKLMGALLQTWPTQRLLLPSRVCSLSLCYSALYGVVYLYHTLSTECRVMLLLIEGRLTPFSLYSITWSSITHRYLTVGIANAQNLLQLRVEPGAEKSTCPKCGGNGILRLANEAEDCSCRRDCIQTDSHELLPYQVRNSQGLTTQYGNLNLVARNKVLRVLQKESSAQLIVPMAPRKLVIRPPETLPLVSSGNLHRFLNVTPGPDTLPYRKAKKQRRNIKLQKSLPDNQTMFVLAESFTQPQ